MTTYVALLDGGAREQRVDVKAVGPGLYEVRLQDRVHLVDAFRHDYGTLSLLVDGRSHSAMLDWRNGSVNVRLRHATLPLEILDEKKLRLRRAAGRFSVEGRQVVTSAMPGKVVKVLVKVGDPVREGQGLVVVEAMKMENVMKAPRDGTVVELLVVEGQAVVGNAKLCTVE